MARGAPDKVIISTGGDLVELARLMVAPGSYLVTAKLVAEGADSEEPFTGTVTLSTGDVAGFGHGNSNPKQISNFLWWPLVLHDVATFARPTVITLTAAADHHGWRASDAILTALRVGAVNPRIDRRALPYQGAGDVQHERRLADSPGDRVEVERLTELLDAARRDVNNLRATLDEMRHPDG